jgi:hypothetical protein
MFYRLLLAIALVCAAMPAQAQTTALFFDSQAGDYIGQSMVIRW